ncbi:3'(2'),5'-bisphosphate nucleotidase [Phytophthora megakarya]|uniref:3'(2'),5'-bisphosphate nucleotidase 1 n=1 Tax=Phytophthora megakarya TaxID=4795 RepID=A0A225V785_9STRA|nr:3'(2'),5'-bisphosphate nucleotidase [Phytophthora megakarya]
MTAATPGPLLRPLLTACFSASVHGGCVIREVVQQQVSLDLVNKQDGAYDPQTVADRRSQQRIIHALREAFPLLTIVGEEGELAPPAPEDVVHCDLNALDDATFEGGDDVESRTLDWKDLVLWVDPLDGTKRFADKVYEEVSVLIGITYKQRPVAGVVHLPFHGKHGVTYWGGPGVGVFRSEHDETEVRTTHTKFLKPSPMFPQRSFICTVSSTNCDLVNNAMRLLAPSTILTGGATGTMVLGVITGHSDAFFRFKAATRKWDICAVEPLIEGLGGKLTDTQGNVYVYDHIGNAPDFDNERGLIATVEPEAHKTVLNVMGKVYLTSALDGQVMTPQWFQKCVFPRRQVSAVNVVPDSIHQGKHSCVAKLDVYFADNSKTTVFVKKSAKYELPSRSAAHWKRDIASYRTEATFYARFSSSLHARGVSLIRPLAVFQCDGTGQHCTANMVAAIDDADHVVTCSDPENFMMLLECLGSASPLSSTPTESSLENYEAADCLELADARQALNYLANLHASAWGQESMIENAGTELWSAACWWAFHKRGEKELAQASDIWPQMLHDWAEVFESESTLPSTAELESLGDRMIEHAAYISTCLSADCNASWRTVVHGDFKSANLFFEGQSRSVVAFDWQWSGVGLGVLDVANLLNTSVSFSLLRTDEQELDLLQFYFDRLRERLQTLGVPVAYTFAAFERHYTLATLEYARLLISNFWRRMTPQSCAAKASNANCGLGYRSVPHVVRMVRKLHHGLERVRLERSS